MKKEFFCLIFFILFLCVPIVSGADDIILDEETKVLCNQVMDEIYQNILDEKERFKELLQFDESVLSENQYGIKTIVYKYTDPDDVDNVYELGLTIIGKDDKIFKEEGMFDFIFPVLGLKFQGYQKRALVKVQYDISKVVNQKGIILFDHQQKYLPLKLTIKTSSDTLKVRERIEYEVVLQNVGRYNVKVKNLDLNSLTCQFNEQIGKKPPPPPRKKKVKSTDIVLPSGKKVKRKFLGQSFQFPQEVEIFCSYNMKTKGVEPAARHTIKIVEE